MHGFRVCICWTLWKKSTFKVGRGLSLAAKQRLSGVKMHGFGVSVILTLWKKGTFRLGSGLSLCGRWVWTWDFMFQIFSCGCMPLGMWVEAKDAGTHVCFGSCMWCM